MSATKTFRHGQILRLISGERIPNQEELRRRLAQQKLRVTQATLSRDLKSLLDSGYQLTKLHMVDLFPQTFHLESVAMLSL